MRIRISANSLGFAANSLNPDSRVRVSKSTAMAPR